MWIKLNKFLLNWYFQQNPCLNIKKHVVHNMYKLAWGLRATAQRANALRRHCRVGLHNLKRRSFHWKLTCSRHDVADKIAELALNNNHSLTHSLTHHRRTFVVKWNLNKSQTCSWSKYNVISTTHSVRGSINLVI